MATHSARGGTLTAKADGAKLKALRGERMQREIEVDTGIPRGQLTRFETGKPVGIKYLLRLARYYNRPARELLHEDGVATTSDLLRDLAELHGAKVDFAPSPNGDHVERCPDCGHQPHVPGGCLNISSDNDCLCGETKTAGLDEGHECNAAEAV